MTKTNIKNEKKRFVELSIDIIEKTSTKKFEHNVIYPLFSRYVLF